MLRHSVNRERFAIGSAAGGVLFPNPAEVCTMSLNHQDVLSIVRSRLPGAKVAQAIILWDQAEYEAGDPIRFGRSTVSMPYRGYWVFVDLEPRVNWGHQALLILVESQTRAVTIHDVDFPPYEGSLPDSVVVLLRYGKAPEHEKQANPFD